MCARISFIFPNYKPRNKEKMRIRRSSQTAVGVWPKMLWAGDSDPIAQWIHRENAERMCLASFVGGLQGKVGRHTRIANPQNMQQALTVALAATEALRQEKGNEIFRVEAPKERSVHNSRADSRRDRFSKGTPMKPKKRVRN